MIDFQEFLNFLIVLLDLHLCDLVLELSSLDLVGNILQFLLKKGWLVVWNDKDRLDWFNLLHLVLFFQIGIHWAAFCLDVLDGLLMGHSSCYLSLTSCLYWIGVWFVEIAKEGALQHAKGFDLDGVHSILDQSVIHLLVLLLAILLHRLVSHLIVDPLC